jgi:hypothetical protein
VDIEQAAEIAELPAPWGSFLAALEATDRLTSALVTQLRDLAAEQRREWEDLAALRDEVHALAAALVSAGIPLVDPPPLRSVG